MNYFMLAGLKLTNNIFPYIGYAGFNKIYAGFNKIIDDNINTNISYYKELHNFLLCNYKFLFSLENVSFYYLIYVYNAPAKGAV